MLIYALAGLLCALYAIDTLLVAYNYRFYSDNPHSSKLLFLSELVKLLIATTLYLSEKKKASNGSSQPSKASQLPVYEEVQQQSDHSLWSRLQEPLQQQQGQGWLLRLSVVMKGMLVFAVPAICYFITNNLSFFVLQIMSAHTYTLLSDLKVITTGVLGYLILDKHLNRQAIVSLCLLFTGISIGHFATLTSEGEGPPSAKVAEAAASNSAQHIWLLGLLTMVLIAVLSAIAAVYTEWVMNFSSDYRHESLNLQNMRLYVSGTLLNGLYCLFHSKAALTSFSDMRPAHWVLVVMYAIMGLLTAVIIKRYGSIVKVYASCVASLFAAGMSYTLLHDPPAPLFYVGCLLAMVATLQLQQARAAAEAAQYDDSSGKQGKQVQFSGLRATHGIPLVATVVILLMLAPQQSGPCPPTKPSTPAFNRPHNSSLGPATDAPMMVLPPFEPTCFESNLNMLSFGCPVMECSRDPSCTVFNTSCCAYFNFQMLSFFDNFLGSRCLQDQYQTVYGTALGAIRNKTIFAHTEDVDLGITPLALQYLELNATREELWRYGYVFWYHAERGVWKLTPHMHHPSPHFRAVMKLDEGVKDWQKRNKLWISAYLDFWLMWPVPSETTNCATRSKINTTAHLAVPWDSPSRLAAGGSDVNPCSSRSSAAGAPAGQQAGSGRQKFCVAELGPPLSVEPGARIAQMGNLTFPTAMNFEETLTATYGPQWRSPLAQSAVAQSSFHGVSAKTHDGNKLQQALLEKLSVTAWGDMPYAKRKRRCRTRFFRKKGCSATS